MPNLLNFSFENRIYYDCENLKLNLGTCSICSNDSRDTKFAKFAGPKQKIWFLEVVYVE